MAQAADRDDDVYRTVDTYMLTRRENIGARPSFVILALDMRLPDDVFYHPVIVELTYHITDLLILGNVSPPIVSRRDKSDLRIERVGYRVLQ